MKITPIILFSLVTSLTAYAGQISPSKVMKHVKGQKAKAVSTDFVKTKKEILERKKTRSAESNRALHAKNISKHTKYKNLLSSKTTVAKKTDVRSKFSSVTYIPHISANASWKSTVTIENQSEFTRVIIMYFSNPDGFFEQTIYYYDRDLLASFADAIEIELPPGASTVLNFDDTVSGAGSISAEVYAETLGGGEANMEDIFVQVNYARHGLDANGNEDLLTSVSVETTDFPYEFFDFSVEEGYEFNSGAPAYSGLAIHNPDNLWLDVVVQIFDWNGDEIASGTIYDIPPYGKLVDVIGPYVFSTFPGDFRNLDEMITDGDLPPGSIAKVELTGFDADSDNLAVFNITPLQFYSTYTGFQTHSLKYRAGYFDFKK